MIGQPESEPYATQETPHGVFRLHLDDEAAHAWLSCADPQGEVTRKTLTELLRRMGVGHGLLDEDLADLGARLSKGRGAELALVARAGAPPMPIGEALTLERVPAALPPWPRSEEAQDPLDPAAPFDWIEAEARVATPTQALPPAPEKNVLGRGLAHPESLGPVRYAGPGVAWKEADGAYVATRAGYLLIRGGALLLAPVLRHEGDARRRPEPLQHAGWLEIEGNVLNGAEIEARHGLAVNGTVEEAKVRVGGDCILRGGVIGKGRARLEVGGALEATYLNGATVVCEGDVIVRREILNSTVHARGRVIIEDGPIIGGEVVALRGILTHQAGSDMAVKTAMVAGLDYQAQERLRQLNRDLSPLRTRQREVLAKAGPLLQRALRSISVGPRMDEEIDNRMDAARELHGRLARFDREREGLLAHSQAHGVEAISVAAKAYPGTTFVVGDLESEVTSITDGPLTAIPHPDGAAVAYRKKLMLPDLWRKGRSGRSSTETEAVGEGEWTHEKVEALYHQLRPWAAEGRGIRVLLADGEAHGRHGIAVGLRRRGYELSEAESGLEALRLIRDWEPHFAVLDLELPDVGAIDILDAVGRDGRYRALRILAVASRPEGRAIFLARGLGAVDVAPKPLNVEDLAARIKAAVSPRKRPRRNPSTGAPNV